MVVVVRTEGSDVRRRGTVSAGIASLIFKRHEIYIFQVALESTRISTVPFSLQALIFQTMISFCSPRGLELVIGFSSAIILSRSFLNLLSSRVLCHSRSARAQKRFKSTTCGFRSFSSAFKNIRFFKCFQEDQIFMCSLEDQIFSSASKKIRFSSASKKIRIFKCIQEI